MVGAFKLVALESLPCVSERFSWTLTECGDFLPYILGVRLIEELIDKGTPYLLSTGQRSCWYLV